VPRAAVRGIDLHYEVAGSGPPVLFISGTGGDLRTKPGPFDSPLARRCTLAAYDQRGLGQSGKPDGPYTMTDYADDAAGLLDVLGWASAGVIGVSFGGMVAQELAIRHPERVDRLVLISPDGFASPGFEYGKPAEVPAMVKLMRYALPKPMLRSSLVPAYGDPAAMTDALATRYYELMLAPGVRDAMIARLEQVRLEDPEPLLRRIRAPTLLLWGERDRMIPVANAQDYLRLLPDARLQVLPGLGHVPHEEAPAVALAPVRAFLVGQ
jgi:pimeloyl-ACP methyl ester carboxylesterase